MREIEERIEAYIGDYNSKRPHIYNDGKTPNEKEREWRKRTGGAVQVSGLVQCWLQMARQNLSCYVIISVYGEYGRQFCRCYCKT